MKRIWWAIIGVGALTICGSALADKIAPRLSEALAGLGPQDEVPVLVSFTRSVDVELFGHRDDRTRRMRMIRALKAQADQVQSGVTALLAAHGAGDVTQLWLINELAATVPAELIDELVQRPEVERIRLDSTRRMASVVPDAAAPAGWNLTAIGAHDLWALGLDGAGIVVATMDTGVDYAHPALQAGWRGGANSWFDPHGEHPLEPYDLDGHGTQALGIIAAGSINGEAIGVAPGVTWIAVKIFDDAGNAMLSDIHQGFQWLLDPDGNSATDDAPDVVNNSWGLANSIDLCNPEFQPDIDALRAAGIAVVFAAGNSGPSPNSSMSPANNPGSAAVGAVDELFDIYQFSGRGPSACGGGTFPTVVAPGVNVSTTDISFGGVLTDPVLVTGTSIAAAHLSGGLVLLKQAFGQASLEELESAVVATAYDLGVPGPDGDFGAGLMSLMEAHTWLRERMQGPDQVEIVSTDYKPRLRRLTVRAKSTAAPTAILRLPDYGNVAMDYNSEKGFYQKVLGNVRSKPRTVTVVSSAGGTSTQLVPYPDTVTIVSARYESDQQMLIVEARSDAQPNVQLQLPEFGNVTMNFVADAQVYRKIVDNVTAAPEYVTVVSSGRGHDTEPVPFVADKVTILTTRYVADTRQLTVVATSDAAPGVRLSLPEYGLEMRYRPEYNDYWSVVRNVATNPGTVTVKSSGSGYDREAVPYSERIVASAR